jgi:hypothetical protein
MNTGNQPDQNQHPLLALALVWIFVFSAVYAALWIFHG